MHQSVKNLIKIKDEINTKLNQIKKNKSPNIVAVSKTFPIDKILPLVEYGHRHFGENKVQEALEKWEKIKLENENINLHLIGGLQSNKVKTAVRIFDYIHSVDTEKLATKISNESKKINKKIKIFIQVNLGKEVQKSGINVEQLDKFYIYCKNLDLDVMGLMCIPPVNQNPEKYFQQMQYYNNKLNLKELSMGMSSDYLIAIKYSSTFLRIGSSIFGKRT
ncbi:YggS family pyridoxal phosphate-dependent enzyme [Candidatus Pelagibacter sp. HIMB1746]|uniref:YggS family pyridoxal phosphate-dependent enzyme n=1 Tax=Candidatus Pelagibacter sp. HIMB1746 TaxID=3413370 RepID=UPI003F86B139